MKTFAVCAGLCALAAPAFAEVTIASPEHYTLKHEAASDLPPMELWDRLVEPSAWWHPDHTYSGDSGNLTLDLQAGGLWREDWDGGSVSHGVVLTVKHGQQLTLDAPFGPLQAMGVNVVWTITIKPGEDGGSIVEFDEVANGSEASALQALAPAVDGVKQTAIERLTQSETSK